MEEVNIIILDRAGSSSTDGRCPRLWASDWGGRFGNSLYALDIQRRGDGYPGPVGRVDFRRCGGDPAVFALTIAFATSNSPLIPVRQINALIIGPAGYKVRDFLSSGGNHVGYLIGGVHGCNAGSDLRLVSHSSVRN